MAECYKTIEYPDRKAIAALYAAGAKAGQIAKEIGVAPRTIYAELKRGREGDKLDKNFRPSYLKLLNWGKCQQTRAKSSKYPEPSSFDSKCKQANGNQMLANVPVNVNENGNGNGNDNENEKRAHSGRGAADGFDRFWASYPRRVGKKDAVAVWKKISPDDALVDRIVAGVERWKRSEQWTKDEGRFIPYPATFLRGERWNESDGVKPAAVPPAAKDYGDGDDFLGGDDHE